MKLVVFDCDGTLVDSQHGIVAAMNDAFAAEALISPDRNEILSVVGLSLEMAVASLLRPGIDPTLIPRLAANYKESFSSRRRRGEVEEPLYPGIRAAIEGLVNRGDVILGVATGKSRRGLDAVLEREGLTRYFATLQTADTHPSKPHPSMLFTAFTETGAEPGQTVMIGDTTFDVAMALAAGTHAIGVSWGYHPADALHKAGAHAVSDCCDQMATAIERLLFRTGEHQ